MVPIMNPNPANIVELFTFVEVTLVQYATVTGHLPGITAASTNVKHKKARKVEVVLEEPHGEEPLKAGETKTSGQGGKSSGKGKKGKSEKRNQQCIPFFRGNCKKGDRRNCEHLVDSDGKPVPVGPELLQRYDEAVKKFNKSMTQNKAKIVLKGGVGVSSSTIIVD